MKVDKETFDELLYGDKVEGFNIIELGEWVSQGKWEHKETIVQCVADQKFYAVCDSRSGSYYSDYTYSSENETEMELPEVFPVEVKTIKYLTAKEMEKVSA